MQQQHFCNPTMSDITMHYFTPHHAPDNPPHPICPTAPSLPCFTPGALLEISD